MALLRGALGLSLGTTRALFSSLSQLSAASSLPGGPTQSSSNDEKTRSFHKSSILNASPESPLQLFLKKENEREQESTTPVTRPAGLSPLFQARSLTRPVGLGSSSAMGPMQVRNYNAYTPAQRYFVEGDHVINAEINRTFQFTGLDSGSFYPFVVYTAFATVVSSVFMIIPLLIAPARVDLDKASAYECGFDAFGEARQTFSVSFYLVSIMYLLFDIEIAYLFPYVMCHANTQMFWTMNLFLSLLVVGFVYEWGVGALEWRE